MRYIITLLLIIFFSLKVFSQNAKVEGKVTDSRTNQPIAGASVVVDNSKGTTTGMDGNFSLLLSSRASHIITVSFVGYKTKEISDIFINSAQTFALNVVLESATKTEEAIVIKTNPRKETVAALISYQKNTNAVASVISSESIKRSPDKNTSEALKRVPGLSIQEGRYLVVRGLSDRYNQAMLNGVLLSSTEPDRKTFSFDIFPGAIIENIIINKTFIPEYSAEWAGGLVQINTRDIPSNAFLNKKVLNPLLI